LVSDFSPLDPLWGDLYSLHICDAG